MCRTLEYNNKTHEIQKVLDQCAYKIVEQGALNILLQLFQRRWDMDLFSTKERFR